MTQPKGPNHQALLAEYCRDSDVRCPACRYSLRGCESDRCPECGCELALEIAAPAAKTSAWWYAALYGAGLAALMSGVILVGLLPKVVNIVEDPYLARNINAGVVSRSEMPNWFTVGIVVISNALCGLMLGWLLHARLTFQRKHPLLRAAIGAACWLSPIALLAAIIAIVASR